MLRRLADELLALVDKGSGLDGADVRTVLERSSVLLKTHVDMEVEILYPPLLEHGDPEIRELATSGLKEVAKLRAAQRT